ncbi:hypothetical protein HDU93_004269, partial [Gonapodya sp. JEL0774]
LDGVSITVTPLSGSSSANSPPWWLDDDSTRIPTNSHERTIKHNVEIAPASGSCCEDQTAHVVLGSLSSTSAFEDSGSSPPTTISSSRPSPTLDERRRAWRVLIRNLDIHGVDTCSGTCTEKESDTEPTVVGSPTGAKMYAMVAESVMRVVNG